MKTSKPQPRYFVVLVTAPGLSAGRRLARVILTARLAACVNLIPGLESHYRWQGKLEKSTEVLLLIKTTRARLTALEKLVLAEHPYDTPEFVMLTITRGNRRYLEWVRESIKPPAR